MSLKRGVAETDEHADAESPAQRRRLDDDHHYEAVAATGAGASDGGGVIQLPSIQTGLDQLSTAKEANDTARVIEVLTCLTRLLEAGAVIKEEHSVYPELVRAVVEAARTTGDKALKCASIDCLLALAREPKIYAWTGAEAMQSAFQIIDEAMTSDDETMVMQAIEFYSTCAETEQNILQIREEEGDTGGQDQAGFLQALSVRETVFRHLLELMQRQDPDADSEAWSVPNAAGHCLSLLVKLLDDSDSCKPLFEYMHRARGHQNQSEQATSLFCLGTIIEGGEHIHATLVAVQLQSIIDHLLIPNQARLVAERAAWAFARMAQHHVPTVFETLEELKLSGTKFRQALFSVASLIQSTTFPVVATNLCWSLHYLASNANEDEWSNFNVSFLNLLNSVAVAAGEADSPLRTAAYTALGSVFKALSQGDATPNGVTVLQACFTRLATIATQYVAGDENAASLLSLLIGVLENGARYALDWTVTTHVTLGEGNERITLRELLLRLQTHESDQVAEDALMCLGAICGAMRDAADEESHELTELCPDAPSLLPRATEFTKPSLCCAAVGVLADFLRTCTDFSHVAEFCRIFFTAIQDATNLDMTIVAQAAVLISDLVSTRSPSDLPQALTMATPVLRSLTTALGRIPSPGAGFRALENILGAYDICFSTSSQSSTGPAPIMIPAAVNAALLSDAVEAIQLAASTRGSFIEGTVLIVLAAISLLRTMLSQEFDMESDAYRGLTNERDLFVDMCEAARHADDHNLYILAGETLEIVRRVLPEPDPAPAPRQGFGRTRPY